MGATNPRKRCESFTLTISYLPKVEKVGVTLYVMPLDEQHESRADGLHP